jgi:hypothetical protein
MKASCIPLLALGAALIGCATTPSYSEEEPRDGNVTVALGGHARFGRVDLVPLRIEEDSRCPLGVECIWAGTVRVAVSIADGPEILAHPITMTLGEPLAIEGGGGVVIVAVCPYPRHPDAIPKDAYRFTFALRMDGPPSPIDGGCGG